MFDDKLKHWLWERKVKNWKATGKHWNNVGPFLIHEYIIGVTILVVILYFAS